MSHRRPGRAGARIAGLLLALAGALPAAAAPGVFLEDHTSPELAEAIRGGATTVLLPIGGTEQNGAHIALGKHNARARHLAEAIAKRLGNALVAPVVAYVPEGAIEPPTAHMRHPGTITVPVDAFEKALESAARSFHLHGFRHVVLLGDHGGYQSSLHKVAARLNREWKAQVVLVPAEYYRELPHAGGEDTALTLAVDPRLVRDSRGASAEAGRRALEEIVARTAQSIGRSTARR